MLDNRRLRRRTTLVYAGLIGLLALLLIVSVNWLIRAASTHALEQHIRDLAAAHVADPALLEAWQAGDVESIQNLLAGWAGAAGARIAAIGADGAVLASSDEDSGDTQEVGGASEVRRALLQGYGRAERNSGPDSTRTLFLALPVVQADQIFGVLRWAVPLEHLRADMRRLQQGATVAILLAAALLAAFLIWERDRHAALMRRLTDMVERALGQDFDGHVLTFGAGEIGQLTRATNRLVDKYRKATKRRAREKDRLTTVLTHMSSGAIILNEFGRVRLINPAAAALLQTTPEKALRQSFVQVVWDHRIAEVWQRCLQSLAEESEAIALEGDRFIRVTVTPFLGGDANGFLVMLENLTAVRRLEKVRRDFVSNVSHELRTPLASLAALVDTLRDGALDDPPAAQRFLDRMEVEVDKMAQMVQELLELSRIESGQLPLRLNPGYIHQFVQPAVERLVMQAERAGLSLSVELPPDLPPVVVDMERMQQVAINLLHNAIKFTPRGGQIRIGAAVDAERPDMVTVRVQDTGVGIPAAEQARIFERFYKSDRSRSGGGTGLGLAIAKHTLQAHGGQIWVESREGQGSTFFFSLPTDDSRTSPSARAAAAPARTGASLGSTPDPRPARELDSFVQPETPAQ